MRASTLILMLFVSSNSFAADETFYWLKSTSGENSALSGTCNYLNSSDDMICNIRQLSVRKKLSNVEAQQRIDTTVAEIDNDLKKQSIKEYTVKEFGGACSRLSKMKDKIDDSNRDVLEQFADICQAPTRQKIIELLVSSTNIEKDTCSIFDYDTGDFEFTPVNENKWVSTNGPTGQCGVVIVMSLEREAKHQTLWNYSQIKHYTNENSELCKELANNSTVMSYSWKGKSPLKMNCKYIDFGL